MKIIDLFNRIHINESTNQKINFFGVPVYLQSKQDNILIGYLPNKKSVDKKPITVLVLPDHENKNNKVYIINRMSDAGKVMINQVFVVGASSENEARSAFVRAIADQKNIGGVKAWNVGLFTQNMK